MAAAVREAREVDADALVAFGGGSPIDAAKIVALELLADGRPQADMPQIAVSTTLSAGEFTPFAGITDEDTRVKGLRNDPRICPRTVVLDPEVTLPTPRALWAATGAKALDHAIEAIWSVNPQPVSDVLAVEAIRRLHRHLPASLAEPGNLEARGECQIAAWMSIFGITSVGVRLSHILGHQIGARWDVPHGVTSCITIPHCMRFLAPQTLPAAGPDCRGAGHPGGRTRAGGGGGGGGGRRGRLHRLARRADPPARRRGAGGRAAHRRRRSAEGERRLARSQVGSRRCSSCCGACGRGGAGGAPCRAGKGLVWAPRRAMMADAHEV